MTQTGLDVLSARGFDALKGRRVGLIANHTAVDCQFRHAADLMHAALGDGLVRLFAPEHGLRGQAQDMEHVDHARDQATGLEVVSLYGTSLESLAPAPEALHDLDVLVFDVQDVGSRYYTFQATLSLAMTAAGHGRGGKGLEVVVLDRPNPLTGTMAEGNVVQDGFRSFVGLYPIAVRHAMTVGELARFYATHCGVEAEYSVVTMAGWRRGDWWDSTGLAWVMPSPNMPTLDTAIVYPGMCLIEGTNLSEGRGTTRPFELVGSPWLNGAQLRRALERLKLPGVAFREASFRPMFQKHAGEVCEGVQLHVTDRASFQPFRTGLAVVREARALDVERFDWRREPYEFESDRLAFDLLCGTDSIRLAIERGDSLMVIEESWSAEARDHEHRRSDVLLYGN